MTNELKKFLKDADVMLNDIEYRVKNLRFAMQLFADSKFTCHLGKADVGDVGSVKKRSSK
jgi:hypothetical protein